ncbi:MAG: DNA glycosylase [Ignavibacteria bacterium CG_4_10_14_3_um_filter_37_18]|nr:MAG: DNA glycosylase [Ignavibacteria bacterium CG_4_10_14_3_um_filter_37_18]
MSKRGLLNWYKLNNRSFFWRFNILPYKIMIAEFMLQRTKAEQVEPVYKKFLQQYPDIVSLSKARIKSVEKYTSSLGLHKRAPNFMNAAKYIINNFKGEYPKTRKELLTIPGVGDYVAGAIMAVCFNNADYVIDSNIARFINRYAGLNLTGEIRRKKVIVEKAKKIFKVNDQRNFLFALLDFTAVICKPIVPLCNECPLRKKCKYSPSSSPT